MKSEEIAKLVGVSRSTVSRVINNYPNVTDETRKKVLEAIEKYKYHPNAYARTLAGKRSDTIGVFLIMDEAPGSQKQLHHNDFFTAYLETIIDIANSKGYYVLVQTITCAKDYKKIASAFCEQRVDGGILIGTRSDSLNHILKEEICQHMVVMDMEPTQIPKKYLNQERMTVINAMDYEAAVYAVSYLKEQGHKKIGFIKGIEKTRSASMRYRGYLDAIKKLGLTLCDAYILEGEFNQSKTSQQMEEAIAKKNLPTVYICANDYMAIAAMECLQKHGIKVPEKVSFIGFDNTKTGALMQPKLTTMCPDYFAMSQTSVEAIHRHLMKEQKTGDDNIYNFAFELIERDTVHTL